MCINKVIENPSKNLLCHSWFWAEILTFPGSKLRQSGSQRSQIRRRSERPTRKETDKMRYPIGTPYQCQDKTYWSAVSEEESSSRRDELLSMEPLVLAVRRV